jgi:hypothetical protein
MRRILLGLALAPAFFHAVCGADNRPPKLPLKQPLFGRKV